MTTTAATSDDLGHALAEARAYVGHLQSRRGSLGLDVRSGRATQEDLDKLWRDVETGARRVQQLTVMLEQVVADEQQARVERRQEIVNLLVSALGDAERQRTEALDAIRQAPSPTLDLITTARDQELYCFDLAHKLADRTGHASYRGRMVLPLAGLLGPEFSGRLPMASGPAPWKVLYDELVALDAEGGSE